MSIRTTLIVIALTVALMPIASQAEEDEGLVSDATEVGYRAGAMSYCKDHHAGDDESKYSLLAISTYKDLDELPSDEKAKALLVMKSVEDKGEYLGKKLDRGRCESLRKTYSLGSMVDRKD